MQKFGDCLLKIVADSTGPKGQRIVTFEAEVPTYVAHALELFPGIGVSKTFRCFEVFPRRNDRPEITVEPQMNGITTRIIFTVDQNNVLDTMLTLCPRLRPLPDLVRGVNLMMLQNQENSISLPTGDWHLPFITEEDYEISVKDVYRLGPPPGDVTQVILDDRVMYRMQKLSLIRTLRGSGLSWTYIDTDEEKVEALFDRMLASYEIYHPVMQHLQCSDTYTEGGPWENQYLHDSFPGWVGYRRLYTLEMIENETKAQRKAEDEREYPSLDGEFP
jgi:hypothetical protein